LPLTSFGEVKISSQGVVISGAVLLEVKMLISFPIIYPYLKKYLKGEPPDPFEVLLEDEEELRNW
jgi:hypothetical protein